MALPYANDSMLCGAKTRSGAPCQNVAMSNGRCRMHGGNALRGIAHPNFVNGRRTKTLPPRLMQTYQESLDDPELLHLRDEIALIDARLNDVLGRVDTGEAGKLWAEARKTYFTFTDALSQGKRGDATAKAALRDLGDMLGKGLTDYAAWNEVQSLIDTRRKLVDAEQKRMVASQQMITAEQAMTFVVALTDIVRRNVTDRATLNAISMEMSKLISVGANQ